jgi:hypothetical protein
MEWHEVLNAFSEQLRDRPDAALQLRMTEEGVDVEWIDGPLNNSEGCLFDDADEVPATDVLRCLNLLWRKVEA